MKNNFYESENFLAMTREGFEDWALNFFDDEADLLESMKDFDRIREKMEDEDNLEQMTFMDILDWLDDTDMELLATIPGPYTDNIHICSDFNWDEEVERLKEKYES